MANKKTNTDHNNQVDTVNPLEGGMAQRLLSQRDELIQVKQTTAWLCHPASWFLSIKSRLNIYKTSLIDVQAGLSNITEVKTYHHHHHDQIINICNYTTAYRASQKSYLQNTA